PLRLLDDPHRQRTHSISRSRSGGAAADGEPAETDQQGCGDEVVRARAAVGVAGTGARRLPAAEARAAASETSRASRPRLATRWRAQGSTRALREKKTRTSVQKRGAARAAG